MAPDRIKVAVVGGGCAALTAAFELTRPVHRGRYEVTVYQQGWRLGGKGASGRGPSGRIEEHGLHLWMGWYENAFRLMRQCYEELDRDPRAMPHRHLARRLQARLLHRRDGANVERRMALLARRSADGARTARRFAT